MRGLDVTAIISGFSFAGDARHYSDEGIKERHVDIVNNIYNITVERMAQIILLGYQGFFPLSPSFLNAVLKKINQENA